MQPIKIMSAKTLLLCKLFYSFQSFQSFQSYHFQLHFNFLQPSFSEFRSIKSQAQTSMSHQNKDQLIHQTWDKAKIHSTASKVGMPINLENYQLCECCDQPIQKVPISLRQHTKEFQIFGFGYSLYFSFLKCCIYLILILIASKTASELFRATKENYNFCYGVSVPSSHSGAQNVVGPSPVPNQIHFNTDKQHIIHNRYRNSFHSKKEVRHLVAHEQNPHQIPSIEKGHISQPTESHPVSPSGGSDQQPLSDHSKPADSGVHHHEAGCTSFMVYFSLFKEEIYYEGTFLRIVEFLMHLIALITIRNIILKEQQYFDERTTSLSDYSIIISKLPYESGHARRLEKLFDREFGMTYGYPNSQIKEIIFLFKDKRLEELSEKKKELQEFILEDIDEENYHKADQGKRSLEFLKKEEEKQASIVRQNIMKDNVPCTKIIVVFNTEADKAEVIRKDKQFDYAKYFEDVVSSEDEAQKIVFKQAPQPNEIIWEHIDESDQDRKVMVWKGYALTFAFISVVTVFFYFVLLAKTRLFISAIEMEYHDPEDAKQFKTFATIIVFLAIFGVVLFNKFVMGKVLHKIVHSQKHAFVDKQNHSFSIKYSLGMFFTTALMTLAVEAITFRNFYSHEYGVIEEETIMFFVTAFLIPLIWFIHPYNLWRRFQYRKFKNKLVSQEKANFLSENVAYDLGKRYAEIFEIMWFTFLYSQLIPLGSFLIAIGLVLYFWVDKYNFLRNSALKVGMSGKMAILALKSLDATLFLPSAGQILFDAVLRGKFDLLALILTLCGIAYLFVPVSKIIWYFNSEKFFLQEKPYQETKYTFKESYYSHHPAYKMTFSDKIKQYKKRYSEKLIEDQKKVKFYGMGRGTYKQDLYVSEERHSKPTSLPITKDSFRSKLMG